MTLSDFRLQLEKLPLINADFTGLGKKVVCHFVRLNASKVTIAVRS
jgi:hypothetical protein